VATPVTTAAFDEPFELFDRAADAPLRDVPLRDAPLPVDPLREDALRDDPLREEALAVFLREDALALLPRADAPALLPRDDVLALLLRDALVFGAEPSELSLDPFELLLFEDLRCVPERELLWATAPP
jgi:hypothetical protein